MSADRAPWIAVDGELLGARAAASGNSGRRSSRAHDGAGAFDASRRQPRARQHQPSHRDVHMDQTSLRVVVGAVALFFGRRRCAALTAPLNAAPRGRS